MRLKEAGFNLQKFVTNSEELRERIDQNERSASRSKKVKLNGHQVAETPPADVHKVEEEDMTYSRSILGTPVVADPGEQRILELCGTSTRTISCLILQRLHHWQGR